MKDSYRLLITALICLLLAACAGGPQPIEESRLPVLEPSANRLTLVDPKAYKAVRHIQLGRPAIDYAQTPNRKLYLPLHEKPGDKQSFVGTGKNPINQISVVDLRSDRVATVNTVSNPVSVHIRGDRLYIGSYSSPDIEIFGVHDLVSVGRIRLDNALSIPPLARK